MRPYLVLFLFAFLTPSAIAADFRTTNFVVSADLLEDAELIAESAERIRANLSRHWFGRQLPRWPDPCFVVVVLDEEGGRGSTTYDKRGEYFNWRVELYGSRETVLHSVLPHEVFHTVVATHYNRRIVPRWFNEGIASSCEQDSEQQKLFDRCIESANRRDWIEFRTLLKMERYPENNIVQFYAQSASLVRYFLWIGVIDAEAIGHPDPQRYSREKLIEFERLASSCGWDDALGIYRIESVEHLEHYFRVWLGVPIWV